MNTAPFFLHRHQTCSGTCLSIWTDLPRPGSRRCSVLKATSGPQL